MGMVRSAVFISNIWGLNKTILGVLVLAIFTGIPDVITAIKLALNGKGLAVMSEAINSNTLNILFGICIPATVFGVGTLAGQTVFSAWWLIGMTFIAMFLLYFKKGFSRINGAIIAALYLVFGIIIFNWK
jgi:cation:H+ antiporter